MLPNKQTKVNQDSYIILQSLNGYKAFWMLGVFDGHGVNGHLVSDYIKSTLPLNIELCDQQAKNPHKKSNYASPSTSILTPKDSSNNVQISTITDADRSMKSVISNQGLASLNKKEIFDLFTEAFKKTNLNLIKQHIDVNFSGSTAVTVYIIGKDLYCANLGDSRAVLASMKISPTLKG
jgi:serine/threonine protein phosphatase PrpC